jgi:LysR family hydrogen peroxide-inducible transcriptional activator
MPSIVQLEYMLALEEYGHFGKAAEACYVSQPTLSMQIQKAELELGVQVFDRSTNPITLTEKGKSLLEQARLVVGSHEKLIRIAMSQKDEIAGDFSLGVIPTLAPYMLSWFLSPFSKRYPQVKLSIKEKTTERVIEELERGTLDAALVALPLNHMKISEQPLFNDPFFVYASPGDPLLKKKIIPRNLLNNERVWLLSDGHCFRSQMLEVCSLEKSENALSNVSFEGGSFETLTRLIQESEGYTLVPLTFARQLHQDEKKWIRPISKPTPTREIGLAYPNSSWKMDIIEAFSKVLQANIPEEFPLKKRGHATIPILL